MKYEHSWAMNLIPTYLPLNIFCEYMYELAVRMLPPTLRKLNQEYLVKHV